MGRTFFLGGSLPTLHQTRQFQWACGVRWASNAGYRGWHVAKAPEETGSKEQIVAMSALAAGGAAVQRARSRGGRRSSTRKAEPLSDAETQLWRSGSCVS